MATRNSAREGHPTSAKGVTQSKAVSLPSPRQAMALLLLQATRILESLERRRVSDVDWNDQDLNVDLSVLLALDGCRVLEQEQDPDAFCDKWRQIGAVLSMVLVARQRNLTMAGLGTLLGPAMELAGAMILITSAGGAFGGMLRNAGVSDAISAAVSGRHVNLILLAWAVAVMLKFAQGSATVSVLTTAAMMSSIMQSTELPYHPMYIFVAIGFGALGISWMNDSGFWVIGRLSGMTERETLRTWSAAAFLMCTVGLIETLILSAAFPFK